MFFDQLPTGITLALVLGVTLAVGLTVMFLVLAIARAATSSPELEKFKAQIEEITRSELEEDRKTKEAIETKSWNGYWYHLVESTGRTPVSIEQPGRMVLIAVVTLAAFGLLVFPGGILGLIALPIGSIFLIRGVLVAEAKKRMNTLNKQLPQLIAGIRANITAGQTPQNSLISVADDVPSPLGDELKAMKQELEVNVPVDVALDHLAERVPSHDIKFLVSAIKIAATSGTDLAPQLKVIDTIINNRTRLNQKLATALSSVAPTIWVSAITIPAMFIFQFASSPENRDFWFTLEGIVIIIIVSGLYAGGLWISKKMVKGVENA